ncbi:alpha/beta fold hydrolase [Roseateles sp. DAIF2]|uniref:alpha/beta fold hydrolase n=1 Tax=Roseateles sp. DAIF2 TaxID=2714952 RepID=UPI0018A255F9|nr:alpha/beta fold hydrolase [Roseateles sp. DAIF2]QPF75377.1 alpha/beta fold hydrolase [Roseateles sp. DAIF2]
MQDATLVLLPGLGCDAHVWGAQLPALAARLPVWVSDLHFHHPSLEAMAAALLAQRPGPLLLCGASMGAMLALQVQALAPRRVRGLALLGSSARPDAPERLAQRAEGIAAMRAGRFDAVMQANLDFALHAGARADAALVQGFLAMLQRCGPAELIRQNELVTRRADLRPLLAGVDCPTRVMGGLDDRFTPPEQARELAAGIAGAELSLLPDCGHMLTLEQPRAVLDGLLGWLARCGA